MKQLIIKYSIGLSLLFCTACSTSGEVSPSQNSALNSISNSSAKSDKGVIQNMLDSFLKEEWTPTVESDKEIQKRYMQEVKESNSSKTTTQKSYIEKEDKYFTLQEYMDKREAYLKVHPSDHNNSNVHKLEMMPVIGNTRRR